MSEKNQVNVEEKILNAANGWGMLGRSEERRVGKECRL